MIKRITFLACVLSMLSLPSLSWAGKLHIRSNTDEAAISALLSAFEQKYQDVEIVYYDHNSNELADIILDNRDNPDFEADVVISSSMDLQVMLVNEGIAHQFKLDSYGDLPDWAQWRDELYGFTLEPVVAVYHKPSFMDKEVPINRAALTDEIRQNMDHYLNRIGIYDIRKSGVGYLFSAQDAIHSNQTFRLHESLGWANVRRFCCSSDILDRVDSGELIFGYNVIGSYALHYAKSRPNLGVILMSDYTLAMARSAFIPRNAHNKEHAEAFVKFLLSYEGQSIMARETSLIPINTSIPTVMSSYLGNTSILPIKFDVGLLAFLDQMKRKIYIENWESSISNY